MLHQIREIKFKVDKVIRIAEIVKTFSKEFHEWNICLKYFRIFNLCIKFKHENKIYLNKSLENTLSRYLFLHQLSTGFRFFPINMILKF